MFFAKEYQFVSNHNEGLNVGYGLGKTGMRHKFDYSDKQAGYGKSIITLKSSLGGSSCGTAVERKPRHGFEFCLMLGYFSLNFLSLSLSVLK